MKQRRQRGALTARRHVRRAKIAYDRSAQRLGQISRFAQLKRRGVFSTRVMPYGLSMQSGELHRLFAQATLRLVRIKTSQIMMPLAEFVAGRLIGGGRVQLLL